jgi:FKBP-type peptidyl-prolyl cis-trans isomerase SlpA
MSDSQVQQGSNITVHFSLTLADGTPVDGSNDGEPITFTMGDGTMISAFEDVILGLKLGDKHQVSLEPRETFGFPDEANHHWIEKEKFSHLEKTEQEFKEGLLIEFDTAAGDKVAGYLLEIKEDKVLVDFNHPLSGHEVIFAVEVISIN